MTIFTQRYLSGPWWTAFGVWPAAIALAVPVFAHERVQANAVDTAQRVCLAASDAGIDERVGPCQKSLIALEAAGLQNTPIYARVQMTLGHIWAARGAEDVAIQHYQSAMAFAQSSAVETGESYEELAVLSPGSTHFCARTAEIQHLIALADLRQSWLQADTHARATIFALPPTGSTRSETAGEPADMNFAARRMMVLMGALFPQFNQPMDVPMLSDRLLTRSVPAFDQGYEENKIALMEALFLTNGKNDSIAAQFFRALGRVEEVTMAREVPTSAEEFDAVMADYMKAHNAFGVMLTEVFASHALEMAVLRRLPYLCRQGGPMGNLTGGQGGSNRADQEGDRKRVSER
jgi:hypothetical protein